MGAGPSPDRVARAKRHYLQKMARIYGGEYRPATRTRAGLAYGGPVNARWSARAELLRASNGEACLMWRVDCGTKSERRLDYRQAFHALGIEEVAQ